VRLLATPARIKRELSGSDDAIALGVLRALWRAAGKSLNDGVIIDVAALPSGLGAPAEIHDTLESLQDRQFITEQRIGGGITLVAPSRDLDSFHVDWHSLDRRRAAELEKLEAVQRYAYTKGCRRAFVLRYFGDPAAGNGCSGCDNCQGTAAPRPVRTEPAKRARPARRPRSASGGAASHRGVAESPDSPDSPDSPHSPRSPNVVETLPPAARELFDRLRELRREIAREAAVPPYIVFDDKTLRQIAVHRPRTLAAFGDLRGIGPVKTERFGPRFIAALADDQP
jgi:ATP-dependent DNA helicase RecQ